MQLLKPTQLWEHCGLSYYAPAWRGIKRWCCLASDVCLSDVCLSVCLSVAYIGPKSTTERPRKIKIGTEVADVTWDSDTTFEVKSSKIKVTWAGAYCGRLPHSLLKLFSATVIVAIILQWIITTVLRWGELPWRRVVLLKYPSSFYYGRTLSERPCYILPMFFIFFYERLSWPNGWTDLHETFTRGRY